MTMSLSKQMEILNTQIDNNRALMERNYGKVKHVLTSPVGITTTMIGGLCIGYFAFSKKLPIAKGFLKNVKNNPAKSMAKVTFASRFVKLKRLLSFLMFVPGISKYVFFFKKVVPLIYKPALRSNKELL